MDKTPLPPLGMDDSAVFHLDMLDDDYRRAFDETKPWVFESLSTQECFETEAAACAAQREYRKKLGFDEMTGYPLEASWPADPKTKP